MKEKCSIALEIDAAQGEKIGLSMVGDPLDQVSMDVSMDLLMAILPLKIKKMKG